MQFTEIMMLLHKFDQSSAIKVSKMSTYKDKDRLNE